MIIPTGCGFDVGWDFLIVSFIQACLRIEKQDE